MDSAYEVTPLGVFGLPELLAALPSTPLLQPEHFQYWKLEPRELPPQTLSGRCGCEDCEATNA
jgi:hypothetical protein